MSARVLEILSPASPQVIEITVPGPQGIPGLAGDMLFYQAQAAEDILKGQPVYMDNSGHVGLAVGSHALWSKVCGLASADVLSSFLCTFIPDGQVVMEDWTAVTGDVLLEKGKMYFLSPSSPGMLTTLPPSEVGEYVVVVGKAMTTTTLDLEIQASVLL